MIIGGGDRFVAQCTEAECDEVDENNPTFVTRRADLNAALQEHANTSQSKLKEL